MVATASRWISIAMEALWLMAVGLVPLVFAPTDFFLLLDIPKVVLLRILTGFMGVLWLVEWV